MLVTPGGRMWDRLLERLTALKLPGGIFRQTTQIQIVLCISVAAVCIVVRLWWVVLVLMLPLFGLVFFSMWRVFNFTDKYPFAAIMEGPELLRLEEIRQGKKGAEVLPVLPQTIDHEPREIPESEVSAPDDVPPQLSIPTDASDVQG